MVRQQMHGKVLTFLTAGFVAAGAASGRAAPLDDRIPADAVVYAGWAGSDSQQGQYAQSNLKGILDASTIQSFIEKQLPPMIDRARGGDPAAAAQIDRLQKGLDIAWHHPVAFYFRSIDLSNPQQPVPQIGLICDAGGDSKALADLLNDALADVPAPPAVQLHIMRDGNVVYLTTGSADTPADLKKNGGLAGAASYKTAISHAQLDTPAMAAYADLPKILALVDATLNKIPDAPAGTKGRVDAAIDALGFKSFGQVAFAAGFSKQEWAERSFVGITGPRKGVLALFPDTPVSDTILAAVPQNASAFSAWKLDLHKIYTVMRDVATQIDPQAGKQLDEALASAGNQIHLDIEKDLLAAMGDEWTFYRAPITDNGSTIALVHHLRDGDAFARSLDTIEKLINANLQNSPVQIEKVSTAKTQVSTVAILQYNIAWTVKNGNLYVSTLDGIGGAIKQVENKSPSILTSDTYKTARAQLPADVKPLSMSYANPAKIYPELRALGLGVLPLARSAGVNIPNDVFPDPDDISKFLTPGMTITWSDATGIYSAGHSAFPGAEALGGAQIGPASPIMIGVAAGVLLPSLGKARELSNRTVDAANIRGLMQGCLVWSADHNDAMPDDLGRLVVEGMVAPKQLAAKRAGTVPLDFTPDMQKLSKDDFAKFAAQLAQHTGYVYLGAGTKNATDASIVIIYEKPGPGTQDGLNLGFQDGHVEFTPWVRLEDAFKETNAALTKAGKPAVNVPALIKAAGATVPANLRELP